MRSTSPAGQTHAPREHLRGQNRFNIEELLQIFSASSFSGITQRRRPPKGNLYASLHDTAFSGSLERQPSLGLY